MNGWAPPKNPKTYSINEVFYTVQGEGANAGRAALFIRFSKCNQTCRVETHGFDCDTEFEGFRRIDLIDLVKEIEGLEIPGEAIVICTGGEPLLQLDEPLVAFLKARFALVCIETNGSLPLPEGVKPEDVYVACSPKVAEHALRIGPHVDELRYVLHQGQAVPRPKLTADHYFLSPAHGADGKPLPGALEWAVEQTKAAPKWELSTQQHKVWGIR